MWWPAIGGLVVGIGGWLFPTALGVGYETIRALLQGQAVLSVLLGVLLVKSTIWAVSLGSGTSGGVLAPLLMMGAALGGLEAMVLPAEGPGFWPLISMAAILGGTMRAPFTAVVFGLELTHDLNAIVPMLLAVIVAHAVTVLTLPRSILTEKVSRRGFHLSREYTVDPLETLLVRDVMDELGAAQPAQSNLSSNSVGEKRPRIVIGRSAPLRVAVYRMAETGLTRLQVTDESDAVIGEVTLEHLLKARVASLDAENRRERHLRIWNLVTLFSSSDEAARTR
jgi:hypothetical protein